MTLPNKLLILDIETKPALAYVWGLWDQTISLNQLIEPSAPISFAAKWHGSPETECWADWHEGGHIAMVRRAHEMLSEADAVIGYNSDSFDLRKLRGEFVLAGLPPVPPLTSIDLLKSVKKLGFQSNKLGYVGPLLEIGKKVEHEGFDLWKAVMEGDKDAQKRMEMYNIGDVLLTEELYDKLLPYIHNHPHLGEDGPRQCGACGSNHLQSRGFRRTKSFKIQRLQCVDCGSWMDGTRSKIT